LIDYYFISGASIARQANLVWRFYFARGRLGCAMVSRNYGKFPKGDVWVDGILN
jgi:hypothetical protein